MSSSWDDRGTDYQEIMLTPWLPGVSNPMFDMIESFDPHNIQLCVDFGCGHGILVQKLKRLFPHADVVGLDYAENMLAIARDSEPSCHFAWGDITNLSAWYDQVDLATTTNSILPATSNEAIQIFREVMATVRQDGIFAGILPSGDAIEHLIERATEAKIANGYSESIAKQEVETYYIDQHGFDPILGLYSDDPAGQHPQRVYWPDEIQTMLYEFVFRNIRLEKVYYPWSACQAFGWGYFPWAERCWDWAFCARRPY